SVSADGPGLLVRPEVAAKQLEAEAAKPGPDVAPVPRPHDGRLFEVEGPEEGGAPLLPPEKRLARFHGSVALDATRLGRDAGKIAEEVVQHLTGLVGADVGVTLEIHAEIPEGVPDQVVRTVTENCRTLRFKQHGFEEA